MTVVFPVMLESVSVMKLLVLGAVDVVKLVSGCSLGDGRVEGRSRYRVHRHRDGRQYAMAQVLVSRRETIVPRVIGVVIAVTAVVTDQDCTAPRDARRTEKAQNLQSQESFEMHD